MNIIFLAICAFIFGAIWGSFLNAVLWRTRAGIPISKGRSMCPQCEKVIAWYDNIPVLSYLFLHGKCKSCHSSISASYPIVELLTGFLFAYIAAFHDFISVGLIFRDWVIAWYLLFIFIYDYRHKEIPDRASLVPAIFVFFYNGFFGYISWQSMLFGAAIGSVFFLFQYVVSKGKWIGGGDIRLGLLMGVILGWKVTIVALLLAYIAGALVGIVLLIKQKKAMQSEIAFGTFLSVATYVCMFYGGDILNWYIGFI